MNLRHVSWIVSFATLSIASGCSDSSGSSGSGGSAAQSGGGAGGGGEGGSAPGTSASGGTGGGGLGGGGGTTGGSGGAGGSATCESGLAQADPACQACQDASCCITASQAAADPGTWTNSAVTICREANCFAECGVEQPECGGIVPSPASCTAGLYENCCPETEACAKSDECAALIYICVDDRSCEPGSTCWDECIADLGLEDGVPIFDTFYACLLRPWPCD